MTESDRILIELFAQQNAIFWPNREVNQQLRAVLYERQRDFHRFGMPWHGADGSEAGRKAAGREVAALASSAMVVRHRSRSARTLALKLSIAGELTACAAVRARRPPRKHEGFLPRPSPV